MKKVGMMFMLAAMAATSQASTTVNWDSTPPTAELIAHRAFNWQVVPPTVAAPSADDKPGTLEQLWADGYDTLKTVLVAWDPNEISFNPSGLGSYTTFWGDQSANGDLWAMDWVDITQDVASLDGRSQDPFLISKNLPDGAPFPVGYNYVFVSFALTGGDGGVLWQSDLYTAAQLNPYIFFPPDFIEGQEPLLSIYPSWGAVPEPTTGLLVLAGAGMLLLRRRARKA